MIQKGVLPGGTAPVNLDDLAYTYASLSNKLLKVTDNSTAGAANGKSGDFADGTNSGDDYVYDDNGNLIIDLNKNVTGVSGGVSTPLGASGITYNFLDKPELIRIAGKGTIQIVYDADGNKLQRKFTPEGGTVRTTTYINEFVYEEGFPPSPGGEGPGLRLSYIHFEEGRIRVMTAVSENNGYDGLAIDGNMDLPNGKRGAYDYFIRDYQQNVRMILTEETHYGIHQATMEPERAGNEEPVFGQTGAGNEVAQTRFAITGIPGQTTGGGWQSNSSGSVSRLGSLTHKAGPNVLLKVMAGDELSATTSYYYKDPVTNSTGNNLSATIITSLIQSILGSPATGLAKDNTVAISNELNANTAFLNKTAPDAGNPNGNNPKAYMTVMFFNERFEFVSEGSTALRVSQSGDGADQLVIPNIKAPKNGYAYVYLSNENAEAVYFDDFKVTHTRGRIIEENHYYAFGLKIAGISSQKFGDPNEGSLKNDYQYNDKELWDDADLNWYDYGFRNYDPQIGRFPQLDPLTDDYPYYTPYQYAGNEPIANVDLDGLEPLNSTINTAVGEAIVTQSSFLQEVVIKVGTRTSTETVAKTTSKMLTNFMQAALRPISYHSEKVEIQEQELDVANGQVMRPYNQSIFEDLFFGSQRSHVVTNAEGKKMSYVVDKNGYLTDQIAYTSLEMPITPSKTSIKFLKYFRGLFANRNAVTKGANLLKEFNNVESLIEAAVPTVPKVLKHGEIQGFIKGDVNVIFKAITKGGKTMPSGAVKMSDGTFIKLYNSTSRGINELHINMPSQVYKIRIK